MTYYRLKMIDFDGSFEYSNIIAVHRENAPKILLYPNPTAQDLHVEFEVLADTPTDIIICNLLGQTVRKQSVYSLEAGRSFLSFNLDGLSAGTYYLRGKIGNRLKTIPFVIVRK